MKAKRGIAFVTSSFTRYRRRRHSSLFPIIPVGIISKFSSSPANNLPSLDRCAVRMRTNSDTEETHKNGSHSSDGNRSDRKNHGNILLRRHLKRLQSSPTQTLLLDGGTGEELFLRGVPDDRKIWSATAIVHEQYHSIVEDVHTSFIDAGSQAITTNSYGITPGVGFTDGEEVKRLVGIAGEIARRAVINRSSQESNPVALVLGSLGPQVESYRPDLIMKHDDGVRAYQHVIEGLYPYIDVYLAETMSCLDEACQAIDALSYFYDELIDKDNVLKHPLLVSFTLDSDGKFRSGESVVDVIPKLIEYAHDKRIELIGVLFNCCEPESITKMMKEIQSNPQIHQHLHHPPELSLSSTKVLEMKDTPPVYLGAYANRLAPIDPKWTLELSEEAQPMREDLSPEQYWEEHVKLWHNSNGEDSGDGACYATDSDSHDDIGNVGEVGVQIIGGCCAIAPGHISVLKERLTEK